MYLLHALCMCVLMYMCYKICELYYVVTINARRNKALIKSLATQPEPRITRSCKTDVMTSCKAHPDHTTMRRNEEWKCWVMLEAARQKK